MFSHYPGLSKEVITAFACGYLLKTKVRLTCSAQLLTLVHWLLILNILKLCHQPWFYIE